MRILLAVLIALAFAPAASANVILEIECPSTERCVIGRSVTGPTGPAGPQGPEGIEGLPGARGPLGPRGNTGTTGPTGAAGITGATGASGNQGASGVTGATGPTGPTGSNGTTGTSGNTGATGTTSSTGNTGSTGSTGTTGSAGTNCFASPEGCGYPSPSTAGVSEAECAQLPHIAGGNVTVSVESKTFTGDINVVGSNITLKHDCVLYNGGENLSNEAVRLENGSNNFLAEDVTVRGGNETTESGGEGFVNNFSNAGARVKDVRVENTGTALHQRWEAFDSYFLANGVRKKVETGEEHLENWWSDRNDIRAEHDTFLNPGKQTANIFSEVGNGTCEVSETVKNSLLAGGGYALYFCTHNTGNAGSSINVTGNHFARRVCAKGVISNWEGRGGSGCAPEGGGYFGIGEGTNGYWPFSGFFGVVYEGEGIFNKGTGWANNVWDDNLAPVQESSNGG